ncbi:MAG: ankyrin repeat domain-containing protein [Acidobacteria bacterium]|nr:ankyrin repeat domain-containing protein [Acidobacteriota bacterium]
MRSAAIGLLAPLVLTCLAACVTTGEDEYAFCDALRRYDPAAAQALFDTGRIDMMADGGGVCVPALMLFDRARDTWPAFIPMAVAVARQEGIANHCWVVKDQRCAINAVAQNGAHPLVLRALLDSGVDLTSHKARLALIDIVMTGSIETLTMMIDAGADKDAALASAVAHGKADMIAFLEKKGAVEHVHPLLLAARTGDVAIIDRAIAAKANLEMTDGVEHTALMRAAMFNRAAVITRLARAGARLNTRLEFETALHMAARENHVEAITALAVAGADLNARVPDGDTPVMVAVERGHVPALAALVDARADVNIGNAAGTTPIGRAIEQGNLALVKQLLRGGARVNEPGGTTWQPPLHVTLNTCGLPPEGPGENDNYRLHLLETLIAAGASRAATNARGETAVQAMTRLRAEVEPFEPTDPQGFRKACFQAKLDYLRTLR